MRPTSLSGLLVLTGLLVSPSSVATAASPVEPVAVLGKSPFRPQPCESGQWMNLSPDGRWLAVIPARDLSLIDVYDLQDASLARTLQATSTATFPCELEFSPDGSQLFCAAGNKWVRGWNLKTGSQFLEINVYAPRALAVSPDSRTLAIGIALSGVQLRDLPAGTLRQTFPESLPIQPGRMLQFSRDGTSLVATTGTRIIQWQVADGKKIELPPEPHRAAGRILGCSSDFRVGLRLVVDKERTGRIQTFQLANGVSTFEVPLSNNVASTGFLGDTHEFAVERGCGDLQIQIWNADTQRLSRVFEEISEVPWTAWKLHVSADGSTLVGDALDRLLVWDCRTGRLKDYCRGPAAEIADVSFSPNGDLLAAAGPTVWLSECDRDEAPICPDGVRFWRHQTAELVYSAPGWRCAGFALDGRSAWLWKHDGTVRQVDTVTFEALRETRIALPNGDSQDLLNGAGKPDSRLGDLLELAVSITPRDLFTASLRCEREPNSKPECWITGGDWNRGSRLPLSATPPQDADHKGCPIHVSLVPDGSSAVVSYHWTNWDDHGQDQYSIGIYHENSRSIALWLKADSPWTSEFSITPDGKRIAVLSSSDREDPIRDRLSLWSAIDGKLRREWNLKPFEFQFDEAKVAVSPNGRWLAVGGDDGLVRFWDVEQEGNEPVGTGSGHTDGITSLAFSRDGKWLASGGKDSTVRVYEVGRIGSGR